MNVRIQTLQCSYTNKYNVCIWKTTMFVYKLCVVCIRTSTFVDEHQVVCIQTNMMFVYENIIVCIHTYWFVYKHWCVRIRTWEILTYTHFYFSTKVCLRTHRYVYVNSWLFVYALFYFSTKECLRTHRYVYVNFLLFVYKLDDCTYTNISLFVYV
jgi:hypothetical protein